jgi:photosystem II stability/assembly factor-like uncharacterized protein
VPCNPSRRSLRARRPRGLGRLVLLVTLGMAAGACTTVTATKGPGRPRVLGEQSGRPAVVGQPAPAGTGQLDAVSCATADRCWAVGAPGSDPSTGTTSTTAPAEAGTVAATVNGGRTWVGQPLRLPSAPVLTGISCPGNGLCMAVGSVGSGAAAGAGIVLTTHDGGDSWVQAGTPAGAIVVASVDCVSAGDCTAIGDDGTNYWSARSRDFGRTWQREGTLPAGLQDPGPLICVIGASCLVTGFTATTAGHGQGAIVISLDAGATWTAANVPARTGLLQSAACATATSCLAVGTTSTTVSTIVPGKGALLVSSNAGQTWTRAVDTQPVDDIFGVDCPQPRLCAMVGTNWVGRPAIGAGAVAQSTNGGTSFTRSETEYTPLALTALTCATPRGCIAVGGDTLARITLPKAKSTRKPHPPARPHPGPMR